MILVLHCLRLRVCACISTRRALWILHLKITVVRRNRHVFLFVLVHLYATMSMCFGFSLFAHAYMYVYACVHQSCFHSFECLAEDYVESSLGTPSGVAHTYTYMCMVHIRQLLRTPIQTLVWRSKWSWCVGWSQTVRARLFETIDSARPLRVTAWNTRSNIKFTAPYKYVHVTYLVLCGHMVQM